MKKLFFLILGIFFQISLIADYSYDENGNVVSIFIPGNSQVDYEYDPIYRLIHAHYPNGNHFSYTYDHNSNLRSIEGPHGTTNYSYDRLGRMTSAQLPSHDQISFCYDLMGRITQLTYPDGETVEYRYDDRGRLVALRESCGWMTYDYDDLTNLVTKKIFPNGTSTSYLYDTTPQVLEVYHRNSKGNLICCFSYQYNAIGQMIQCTEETPSSIKITKYAYDKLDRLISVEDNHGDYEKYSYDAIGNRLTKSTPNGSVSHRYDHKNRLIQTGDTFCEYDSVGNLTKKTSPTKTAKYSYDPTGKLISYSDGENNVQFDYDGEGRRISKTVNGKKVFFTNDPNSPVSRVLMEKDSQGHFKRKYIYGHSRVSQIEKDDVYYFLYDQPGKSVSHLLDHQTEAKISIPYDSFGLQKVKTSETPYQYTWRRV